MEFSVRVLVWLLYALDVLNYIECLDEVDVDSRCVADKSENCLICAGADMNVNAETFEPVCEIVELILTVFFL